jgi:hypothetical protein
MVTGGGHGRDAGIVHATMTQDGNTTGAFHLFMQGYLLAGGMIIESIVGEDITGTTSKSLIISLNATGMTGKKTSIGKSAKTGGLKAGNPDHTPGTIVWNANDYRLNRCSMNRKAGKRTVIGGIMRTAALKVENPGHNPERTTPLEGPTHILMRVKDMESINERRQKDRMEMSGYRPPDMAYEKAAPRYT